MEEKPEGIDLEAWEMDYRANIKAGIPILYISDDARKRILESNGEMEALKSFGIVIDDEAMQYLAECKEKKRRKMLYSGIAFIVFGMCCYLYAAFRLLVG